MTIAVRDNTDKERVRDASDIVRVIGEVVALKAKGREFVCLCPFHDDHRPSMNVVPAKQIFKCFVCGAGGDVFSFVQKYHHMEFREALEYLAERAGMTLAPLRPAAAPMLGEDVPATEPGTTRADLVRANALAAEFFRLMLRRQDGEVGREVIRKRGISDAMVEGFGLGLSPDRWDGLLLTIQNKGMSPSLFAEAGLLKQREGERAYYDSFRNRLMFPIHDQIGRVIAFGARKIRDEDEPKYLNSPETRLFEKSGTLYGLYQAAKAIQTERTAIVTEGYTDTIACHQAGVCNAVATLGTALTLKHAAVLRRLCDTVVLLFDGDDAGQRAADRAVEVFFAEEIDVKIATLSSVTDAKDPDELLKREGGVEVLRAAVAKAVDLLEYRYARIRERLAGAGMSALDRAVEEDLKRLVDLGFGRVPLRRRMLIVKRISALTGLSEKIIAQSIPAGRNQPQFGRPSQEIKIRPALTNQARALGCLLCDAALWGGITDTDREALDPAHFSEGPHRRVAEAMFEIDARRKTCDLGAVLTLLENQDDADAATDLYADAVRTCEGANGQIDPTRLRSYFRDCLGAVAEPASDNPIEFVRERAAASGPNRRMIPRPRISSS